MEVKFKPKFWKDINKLKDDAEVVAAIGKVITQIERQKISNRLATLKN